MADFSSGVSGYVVGEMHIKVFFPIDLKGRKDVCCCQCDYYGRNSFVSNQYVTVIRRMVLKISATAKGMFTKRKSSASC